MADPRIIEQETGIWTPYVLGAPVSLSDLLALPPDGNRYGRDEKGRLVLMAPDDAAHHRIPLAHIARKLSVALDEKKYVVVPEAPISFSEAYALDGSTLPPSHHGPKALVCDLACFALPVRYVTAPSGHTWFSSEGLLLVVELLSPTTWTSDLGEGTSREVVDRWRTYLENRVSEYWILNAGFDRCGLPSRSGLFLSYDRDRSTWSDLVVERPTWAPADVHGRRPAVAGTIRSGVLPQFALDLAQLWRDCGVPE